MRGAREEFFLVWVPSNYSDLVLMLLENVELLHHPDIVHLDRGVTRPGEQPVTIDWVPSHLVNSVIVRLKSVNLWAESRVPYFDLVVLAPSDNQRILRVPVAGFNIGPMPFKSDLLFASQEIKNPGSAVIRAGNELERAQREAQISDTWLVVRLELVLLTYLIIRVDDIPLFVPWNDEFFIVGPSYRLHSVLMHRSCFLILIIWRIPDDKLPRRGTGDHSFASLHPGYSE
jgi:hypothetical protein